MKLNQNQRIALAVWLGSKIPNLYSDHSFITRFDEFCDGNISDWRIIYNFGMAGKIWNILDKIYITGYSKGEIGQNAYQKQQKIIDEWNKEIVELLTMYS